MFHGLISSLKVKSQKKSQSLKVSKSQSPFSIFFPLVSGGKLKGGFCAVTCPHVTALVLYSIFAATWGHLAAPVKFSMPRHVHILRSCLHPVVTHDRGADLH